MSRLTVLLVDDEEDIRDIMSFLISARSDCEILTAANGQEAIDIFNQKEIDVVFCDHNMPVKTGSDVYLYLKQHSYQCHFVLVSADEPSRYPAFADSSYLFGNIIKPKLSEGVKEIFARMEQKTQKNLALPADYTPIAIRLLLHINNLPCSIYIQLSTSNYIKVFDQGDVFDETDFVKYQQKGIEKLYALNFGIEDILNNIQSRIEKLLNLAKTGCKVDVHMEIHSLILSSVSSFGLRDELSPLIEEQMNAAIVHCTKDKLIAPLLTKLLRSKDFYLSKHSFMLAAISIQVAERAGWPSAATVQKLTFASLFHDIFLKEGVSNELALLMAKKLDSDFLTHPSKAAELLDQITSVPPDTGRIILEQHEIGGDLAFPKKLLPIKVSPLGQLFSFVHVFVDIILDEASKGIIDPDVVFNRLAPFAEGSSQYRKFMAHLKDMNLFMEG